MTTSSTKPEIEIVYEEEIKPLDESQHYDNKDLVKIINKLIRRK
jgi:hypothetical protein